MANPTFEELFRRSAAPQPRPEERGGRIRLPAYLRSGEEWITFGLLLLVQFPVVSSLESTNWVDEMPSLLFASMAGFLSAWAVAHTRLRARFVGFAGLAIGATVTMLMVLQTMRLADPLLGTGLRHRWSEFWVRLGDWSGELVSGGVSTDELPFVVLLVLIVFGVSYLSTWSVVRWRNAWVALVPGGFVLLTNISYLPGQPSFAFMMFLFGGALLITRMHFQRSEARWGARRVAPPELMSLEVLFVSAWVGLILIVGAWLVPTANNWGPVADGWERAFAPVNDRIDRFGQLFIGIGSKENRPVHTFSGSLPLRGSIKLSDAELFRVTAGSEGYLRGAVYNEYNGNSWSVNNDRALAHLSNSVEAAEFGTAETLAQLRTPFTAEIEVVGDGPDRRLLVPGDAIATDAAAQVILDQSTEPIGLVPDDRLDPGITYRTVGSRSAASISSLVAAGTDYPAGIIENYTALPDSVPSIVYDLGDSLTADSRSEYESARRVEDYLRREFPFSLNIEGQAPGADAVEHFLFRERAGYFDQFASAMAVLLRTQGIPTRVVVGFVLDDATIDPDTKQYILTEESAFAWTEVYFPGYGWVEFNPTPAPGRTLVARPGDDSELRADLQALLNNDAFTQDLEEALFDDILALEDVDRSGIFDADGNGGNDGGLVGTAGAALVRILTFLVILGGVGVVAMLTLRFFWLRQFRAMSPATARWAKVMRLSVFAGIAIPLHRTPHEAMADLAPLLGEPTALRRLGASYTLERYGRQHDESEHEQDVLDSAYLRIRARLWRMAVRRFVPWSNVRNQLPSHRPA